MTDKTLPERMREAADDCEVEELAELLHSMYWPKLQWPIDVDVVHLRIYRDRARTLINAGWRKQP